MEIVWYILGGLLLTVVVITMFILAFKCEDDDDKK